jgi:hypothetical protein
MNLPQLYQQRKTTWINLGDFSLLVHLKRTGQYTGNTPKRTSVLLTHDKA